VVIDACAFVGRWPFWSEAWADAQRLLALREAARIEVSLVSPLGSVFYKDPHDGNEELFAEVQKAPDRLKPVVSLNPYLPGWERRL